MTKREPNPDFPTGLEQRCIAPGKWLIEGYTVQRVKREAKHDGRSRYDAIVDPKFYTVWEVRSPDGSLAMRTSTLQEARHFIAAH